MSHFNQYITVDKEIAAGVPVFRGTRVAVKTLFDYLEDSSLSGYAMEWRDYTRGNPIPVFTITI